MNMRWFLSTDRRRKNAARKTPQEKRRKKIDTRFGSHVMHRFNAAPE